MNSNGQLTIELPKRLSRGDRSLVEWCNAARKCLQQLRDRKQAGVTAKSYFPDTLPPFWPLFRLDGANWKVKVTPGVVLDHATDSGDAVEELEATNQFTTGELTEFTITDGKYIAVTFDVGEDGAVDPETVELSVVTGTESLHYVPIAGGDTAGAAGDSEVKLAQFNIVSGVPEITYLHAGSNISHYRELPSFVKAGGTADVIIDFDQDTGKYRTRGITGGTGITVTENGTDIEVKLSESDVADLNLEVYQSTFGHDGSGHLTVSQATTPEATYYWRNGLFVGTDAPAGDPPAGLLTRKVSYNSIP